VSDTRRLAVFIRTTGMELATLIPMKLATKGTDLYEEPKKCYERPHIPIQNLAGLVMNRAPSTAGRNTGVSSLPVKEGKDTTDRIL
jgi:hypothetical protein